MKIGYHASHEQFSPSTLLKLVCQAEAAGFAAILSSDHFAPWSVRQGQSGFTWSWLGAVMQSTTIPFGSLAIPGGWRYHPAILAQAISTLAEMFPNRLPWIAAGSGEAINEHVVGQGWPDKSERQDRLLRGVAILRSLWLGQTVTFNDGPKKIDNGKLWSRAKITPQIYAAALSPETAEWAGGWADGLITVRQSLDDLKIIIDAFRHGGGVGKPLILQMQISWAENMQQARLNAWDQWRQSILTPEQCANITSPEELDQLCNAVTPEEMDKTILISSDLAQHTEWIKEYGSLGFDEIYLHNAGRNQSDFIRIFGQTVLPFFKQLSPMPYSYIKS